MIGREHIARVRANSRSEVAAIADPSPAAAELARDLGIEHYATTDALLMARRPDGAIVATPNNTHAVVAGTLLRAGVPVLVEKPIAGTLADGCELVCAAESTRVPVLVGHHRRHSPSIQAAQACIAAGTLGRIVAVNATTLFYKPAGYFDVAWRRRCSDGGGPILINMVHDIDSLRAIAGEITAVQAIASSAVRGFEVEDTAAVILEFANGAVGSLVLSDTAVAPRSWEQTSGENPLYFRAEAQDCLFIAGTHGSLAIPTMRLWRQDGERSWTQPLISEQIPVESADPLSRQLDHFCDVIEGRATPLVSASDGLCTLAATLAVGEAARTRMRIEVSE
jgi:predicted dehydrogenase